MSMKMVEFEVNVNQQKKKYILKCFNINSSFSLIPLFFQASVMTGGYEVQYIRQEIDVAWYGRACIKLVRDKVNEILFFASRELVNPTVYDFGS